MNRNSLLSSQILGEKHTGAGGVVVDGHLDRDLPRLWEFSLPFNDNASHDRQSIEIQSEPSEQSSGSSTLGFAFQMLSSLWFAGSQSSSQTCGTQIAIPNRQDGCGQQHYIAVIASDQLILMRSQQGILDALSTELLVFSVTRLGGKPLAVCWTNEETPSLMIGTTNGLRLLLLPSLSHVLEHASVEMREVRSLMGLACSSLCASPQGRYALVSDGRSVWLTDNWLHSLSLLISSDSTVESMSWSSDGEKIFVHHRSGQVTVLESFAWQHRQYRISIESMTSMSQKKFAWAHGHQSLLAAQLNASQDISRVVVDNENPRTGMFSTKSVGDLSAGLRASPGKVIHDFLCSANGRFLVVSYACQDTLQVDSTLEVFECVDVECDRFQHISSVQRYGAADSLVPLTFSVSSVAAANQKTLNTKLTGKKPLIESDIYIEKVDLASRKLSLFPASDVRAKSKVYNTAERYVLWVLWSDNVLIPYLLS